MGKVDEITAEALCEHALVHMLVGCFHSRLQPGIRKGKILITAAEKAQMEFTVCFLALCFIRTGMAAKTAARPCDQSMFHSYVDNCLSAFNNSMETSGYEDSCTWPAAKGVYYQLKMCVHASALLSRCRVYGFLVDEVYLAVHRTYFSLCGQVHDPPPITLFMLMSPCIFITLLLPFLCLPLTTKEHVMS